MSQLATSLEAPFLPLIATTTRDVSRVPLTCGCRTAAPPGFPAWAMGRCLPLIPGCCWADSLPLPLASATLRDVLCPCCPGMGSTPRLCWQAVPCSWQLAYISEGHPAPGVVLCPEAGGGWPGQVLLWGGRGSLHVAKSCGQPGTRAKQPSLQGNRAGSQQFPFIWVGFDIPGQAWLDAWAHTCTYTHARSHARTGTHKAGL